MISEEEKAYIESNLYITDHDYFFESSMRGEPFIKKDILHYFDGEALTIVGYALDKRLNMQNNYKIIREIIIDYLKRYSIQIIHYYGPWIFDFKSILETNYKLIYCEEKPDKYNISMSCNLLDPNVLKTEKSKESLSKAIRNKYKVQIKRKNILDNKNIELIRALATNCGCGLSDVSYFLNIMAIMKSDFSTFIEIFNEFNLVGFAVVHEYFDKKPFLVFTYTDKKYKGASDILYATIINHYIENGAKRLDLGYSVNKGIFNFKNKWGGISYNEPYYQIVWSNNDFKIPVKSEWQAYLHWPMRLHFNILSSGDDLPLDHNVPALE